MGMREEIQTEMAAAFDDPDGLADAVRTVLGARQGESGYDPATGDVTAAVIDFIGRGIFGSYQGAEIDGSRIQTLDERLTVLQNELFVAEGGRATEITFAPEPGDLIDGRRVVSVGQDPACAIWTIQLRK